METFELVRSDEERKKHFESTIEYLKTHGTEEEWRLREILKEPDSEFGLNNPIPEMGNYEERALRGKFEKRADLIKKYKALSDTFQFLLDKEKEIWSEYTDVSEEICDIEGHRLSSQSYRVYVYDGNKVKTSFWVRKCIICGKEVSASEMTYRDCVVKGEEGPKRLLEQKKSE